MDGDGATETVEPLLLVEDVVDLQGVRLGLTRVLRPHTENVLGCGDKSNTRSVAQHLQLFPA